MTRIVNYAHRYKRPPKRKPAAIAEPAIVRKRGKADATPPRQAEEPRPANDDRKPPPPGARKSAIITTTNRKRTKLLRAAERTAGPDAEADAAMRE